MEKIAEKITEGLVQQLPKDKSIVTPQELFSSGVPSVVVATIQDEVSRTVESGMKLPESNWVDTDSDHVIAAWNHFVDISKDHIKIPVSKIHYLLEEAVEQCLELSVKPRQSIPEIIFKTRKKIDLDRAKSAVANLPVNQELGFALIRYMEKKGKTELTKQQARDIIKKIDQKLVEDYHPLSWAKALKPVFELAGPDIHSELLRIFFEDKEKHVAARKFDLLEKKVDETEFIEIMSSAELLEVEDDEESQPKLFDSSAEKEIKSGGEIQEEQSTLEEVPEKETSVSEFEEQERLKMKKSTSSSEESVEDEENPVSDTEEGKQQQDQVEDQELAESMDLENAEESEKSDQPKTGEKNIVDLFSEIDQKEGDDDDLYYLEKSKNPELSTIDSGEESEGDDDNITLINKFIFDESESEETAEEGEKPNEQDEKREPSSIYEEMNLVKEDQNRTERMSDLFDDRSDDDEDEEEKPDDSETALSYKILEVEEDEDVQEDELQQREETHTEADDDEEEEDLPMWRSFLERDELEAESGYEYEEETDPDSEEEEEETEEGFIEEPIYDLTVEEADPDEKLREISKWLDDEKDRFIEEIFSNSESAYEQALLEIIDFDDWKSASLYLEKEIFSRNRIDVYDEAAVDFTDRLHSYFMQNN